VAQLLLLVHRVTSPSSSWRRLRRLAGFARTLLLLLLKLFARKIWRLSGLMQDIG
jgi:hypothetical protein